MAAGSHPSRRDQASIRYWWVPLHVASSDLSNIDRKKDVSTVSAYHKASTIESEPRPPDILSTAKIVSAIGQAWGCASHSLPLFQPKSTGKQNENVCKKENVVCYSNEERDNRYVCVDLKSVNQLRVNSNLECADVDEKISLFSSRVCSFLNLSDSDVPVDPWKAKSLETAGILYNLGKIYGWLSEKPYLGLKYPVNLAQVELRKPDHKTNLAKCKDLPSDKIEELVGHGLPSGKTLEPVEHGLRPLPGSETKIVPSKIQTSSVCSDYHIDHLDNNASGESQRVQKDDEMFDSRQRKVKDFLLEDEPKTLSRWMIMDKTNPVIPNKRHAFAGALAGTFVSLSLHPVDTIKTLIQSHSMSQTHRPISHIVGSIISERGVMGLYRGIASNIASSAPISAVYTFTYESVKGALLPLLPKEYHSIAHCTAGGCASIATSFIFTPSERIKQQMQVSSHYQNCWTALIGILEKGSLPSLYAGWGAVLCRNIPHSVIKFYTYERLKQLLSSSAQSNAHPSTIQTLLCGGLAGSTAALFTTPFDVVKTRLQTEIPGSLSKYAGVSHALQEISKREGLKGLYRGLTPRLVMYVSQGAIFFASYEFFKSILSLDLPQVCAPTVQNEELPAS
ncbi:hypothetical protein GIB67_022817 [Kingdonia uniflora]|uniref:Mitochondrial substrate carrier family protein n=1 Tax=Kingdonia uniflora TaxID=39325 RepID=A0A7J7P6S5_9MAGN|nr:hypothetical protein GIB67_022817 [Kingdonia uniflora]